MSFQTAKKTPTVSLVIHKGVDGIFHAHFTEVNCSFSAATVRDLMQKIGRHVGRHFGHGENDR